MKKYKLTIIIVYALVAFGVFGYLGFFSTPNKEIPCLEIITLQNGSKEFSQRDCTWIDSSLAEAGALIYIVLPIGVFQGVSKVISNRKK